jgi:hypothetical protein
MDLSARFNSEEISKITAILATFETINKNPYNVCDVDMLIKRLSTPKKDDIDIELELKKIREQREVNDV